MGYNVLHYVDPNTGGMAAVTVDNPDRRSITVRIDKDDQPARITWAGLLPYIKWLAEPFS